MSPVRRRRKTYRIALFNHKGGVGKTTLTVNIADALAVEGYRVLLVDSDPQCNLTSYLVEDSVVDGLLNESDLKSGKTVWSAVKERVAGTGPIRKIEPIELQVDGMFLAPGDIKLSDLELLLNDYWVDAIQRRVRGFEGLSLLSDVATTMAHDIDADFIFYDCGPNVGPLNRSILLDCDYFVVPVACDLFSLRALGTLGATLKDWLATWGTISALAPDGVRLLPGQPHLLGFIPQRFRAYGHHVSVYKALMGRLERGIYNDVITPLRAIDKRLASASLSGLKLGEVSEFGELVTLSQLQGCPIRSVTGGDAKLKSAAQREFKNIAKHIASRLGLS